MTTYYLTTAALLYTALLTGGLTSCGKSQDAPHAPDAEVQEVIVVFEETTQVVVPEMPVIFEDLVPEVVAWCILDNPRYISVDKKRWKGYSKADKEMLILHELGHCVLNYKHLEGTIVISGQWRYPASIMSPYMFDDAVYRRYRHLYLRAFAKGTEVTQKEIDDFDAKEGKEK